MERINIDPRKGWKEKVESQGFLFHDLNDYYTETAAYSFTSKEIDDIDVATSEIFDMCLKAVQYVIDHELWDRMFIPKKFAEIIKKSWSEDYCSFYGRLDLAVNNGQIKLLEFNADTPTGLLEASVIQWHWLQDYNSNLDQFNSIHEKLVNHIKVCKPFLRGSLYLSSIKDHVEDYMTVKYIEDCANQACMETKFVYIEDISVNDKNVFCDPNGEKINNIFKLYPYEWMFNEDFGNQLITNDTIWIEPFWKCVLSNKMLMVILWELFPYNKYLLPCFYGKTNSSDYVKKPVYSREGANIQIYRADRLVEETEGDYGEEGYIYQDYFELPDFNGNKPIIGSWLIGGETAGIGIREGKNLITNNTSAFVSHFFKH